jgi:hypothetical protein
MGIEIDYENDDDDEITSLKHLQPPFSELLSLVASTIYCLIHAYA